MVLSSNSKAADPARTTETLLWMFAQAGLHSPPAGLRQHRSLLPRRQIGPHTPRGSLQRHLLPDKWKADIQRRCRDERGIPQGGGGAGSQATSQHWGPAWGEAHLWLCL